MGSSISGILAILFMDTLERRALLSQPGIGLYARYVDDIFALVENREAAEELLRTIDQQHQNIKFELEHADENNALRRLDFCITIGEEAAPQFDFYKKKAKRDIFVHPKSALPWNAKMSIIRNEKQRIKERCSTNGERLSDHMANFTEMLTKNGYPRQTISRCDVTQRHGMFCSLTCLLSAIR